MAAQRFCGRAAPKGAVFLATPQGRCGQAHMIKSKLQHDQPATRAQAKDGTYMQTRRSLDNAAPFIRTAVNLYELGHSREPGGLGMPPEPASASQRFMA